MLSLEGKVISVAKLENLRLTWYTDMEGARRVNPCCAITGGVSLVGANDPEGTPEGS